MADFDDGLSRDQAYHFIEETTSARNLLAYGGRALRQSAFHITTSDPVMTLLSIGAEKLLKLGLGLRHLADTREWPSKDTMQKRYRHDLVLMDRELRDDLRGGLDGATNRFWIEQALDVVDADPVWDLLLGTLDRYGQQGRFYYLDALADNPQKDEPPTAYWDRAERAALASDVQLNELFHLAAVNTEHWDRFTTALNARMAQSIDQWWAALSMAGIQGMMGERGRSWGHDVKASAVGRQVKD